MCNYQDEFETDISAAAMVRARMEHAVDEYAKALMTIADLKAENQRLQNQVIALRDYMDSRAGHPGKKDGINHLDIFLGLNPEYK